MPEDEATEAEAERPEATASDGPEPQATQPFDVLADDGDEDGAETQPGDTGSWLAGLEPPDRRSDR